MASPRRFLVSALLLVATACSRPDAPPADAPAAADEGPTPPIRTDTTVFALTRDSLGWSAELPLAFLNVTADTLYAINCNGALTLAVERREGAAWTTFWAPMTNACLSPPVTIAPGAVLALDYAVWGAPPNTNVGPAFADTTFAGTYRLVWWNLVSRYDTDRPQFGDTVAVADRVSNEFTWEVAR